MTAFSRILFLLVSLMAVITLAGCGATHCATNTLSQGGSGGSGTVNTGGTVCGSGTTGGGPSAAFAFYVGSGVETAGLSVTGNSLTTLTNVTPPALAGTVIDDMAVVNNKFLYLPFGDINAVQAFTINTTTGGLTEVSGSPFPLTALGSTDAVVNDPQNRFLFIGGEGTGLLTVFQINSTTGALTEAPGSPFNFGLISADSMAVDGNGKFLYVGQLNSTSPIAAFSIDQNTGALSPIVGSPFALGVAQVHADSSGKFLLGVATIQDQWGAATDKHIHVFSIDSTTGAPSEVAGSPFLTISAPFDFAISPNGKFVYVQGNDSVGTVTAMEGYQLDPNTGTLTLLAGSPFTALPAATQCRFDESGGLMFCSTNSQGALSAFTTNVSTGAIAHSADLTSIFSYPFAVTD